MKKDCSIIGLIAGIILGIIFLGKNLIASFGYISVFNIFLANILAILGAIILYGLIGFILGWLLDWIINRIKN